MVGAKKILVDDDCYLNCLDCHRLCLQTIQYCLEQGGEHAEERHIRAMLDCAEMCETCSNFLLRGSEIHGLTCAACAEACERCARECARFEGDAQMQGCASVCRRCAASCRLMATPLAA
ncbi:four-helix bundle copper-binding protein [Chondromyces crocatus]|uniref:Ferredoxin n=1 Tax=Chondromyces crocatus TaxID=52 RepID=A0A0K1EL55_CHOCO|nr:four-helix bundle copper-binding protein [Chondromyces crocatus]AKT41600.1 ferredoxin [Chondromyces crocatus]